MSYLSTLLRRLPWLMARYQDLYRILGLRQIQEFSISLYGGPCPSSLGPLPGRRRPVLTRRDVDDVPAAFVADPFLLRHDGGWTMFFEIMRSDSWRGVIAIATSPDTVTWTYGGVVLTERFHLSYPHVFEWDGEVYMIPETFEARSVRLYRATRFPTDWVFERTLLAGASYSDASVFRHDGRWWMLVEVSMKAENAGRPPRHDTLELHHADDLAGPWVEHPASPIVAGDARFARPAGRVVADGGVLLRFAQDCTTAYGLQVHAFEIQELTPTRYRERLLPGGPVAKPGRQRWHRGGMHHVDAHPAEGGWIAAVDGWSLKTIATARPAPEWLRIQGLRRVLAAVVTSRWPISQSTRADFVHEDSAFD